MVSYFEKVSLSIMSKCKVSLKNILANKNAGITSLFHFNATQGLCLRELISANGRKSPGRPCPKAANKNVREFIEVY